MKEKIIKTVALVFILAVMLVFLDFSKSNRVNLAHNLAAVGVVKNDQPYLLKPQDFLSESAHGVPVLMYHYIGDMPAKSDALRSDLTVNSKDFTAEMDWLKNNSYSSITVDQLYNSIKNGTGLPPKPVIITFDDGYKNTFDNAVPILLAHGMTGSFGIITGYVGNPNYAPWDEIKAAQNSGMEIVSHSFSHIDFTAKKYTYADKQYEIVRSKEDLLEHLGITSKYFIYPYGHHDADTEKILKDNGFVLAFTVVYGFSAKSENLLELPRVRVHGVESLDRFVESLGQKTAIITQPRS